MPFRDRNRRFSVFWSGGKDIFNPVLEEMTRGREFLLRKPDLEFVAGVLEIVRSEIRVEEEREAMMESFLADLSRAVHAPNFESLGLRFRDEADRYFQRRRSVPAFQSLCAIFREAYLKRCIDLAGEAAGAAVFTLGRGGRNELNPWDLQSVLVIHSAEADAPGFLRRIFDAGGIFRSPAGFPPTASLDEWRGAVIPELIREEGPPGADAAADLRFVAGDAAVAESAVAAVFERYGDRPDLLRGEARRAAVLPLGKGLLGIFRVERHGEHRGELNVVARGLFPLVGCVRILAIHHGIRATGTRERIRRLLEMGRLDVGLSEDLVRAYDVFSRMEIQVEFDGREKDHSFVDPGKMRDEDSDALREAFEAVETLQRIIYSWAGQ